jgi:hypothetical protein
MWFWLDSMQWKLGMIFTVEFFRIRPSDDAHATLDRIAVIVDDLDAAKVKAKSLFETLEMFLLSSPYCLP